MRPKIMPCHKIAHSITYNEKKVQLGKAECLVAANFLKETSRLSLDDKLSRFQRRMELNDRVSTNQHITLNFDPGDKLTNETMKKISILYMKEIGFEHQPYLVYRHTDSGHPHCHIVTTHVQKNGDPIDLYKIGENQSEKARIRLEAEFGLITAEMKKEQRQQKHQGTRVDPDWPDRPFTPSKVIYGEESTTQAISKVLEYVMDEFKYTSLKEFNAILRLYNVVAYTGKEGTKLHHDRGILYRILDEHGSYIGRPLKASFFDCKPTLPNLEKKFVLNLSLKEECRESVNTRLCWPFAGNPDDLEKFKYELAQERMAMILDRDKAGNVREVTYIDFQDHSIFSGSELEGTYNEQAVQQLFDRHKLREAREALAQSLGEDTEENRRQQRRYRISSYL